MAKDRIFDRSFKAWSADIDAFMSNRGINQDLKANQEKAPSIARKVIATAISGRGPNGTPYPEYSESYKKALGLVSADAGSAGFSKEAAGRFWATGKGGKHRVQKATQAGMKRWLRGIDNTGNKGGMLGIERFSIEVNAKGRAWLVWTPADDDMATYARVHNFGLPIGKGGPRKQREWMHLQSVATATAVYNAYLRAIKERVAKFNAKRKNTK